MEKFLRKEFKYYIPQEKWEAFHDRVITHMSHDPYCADREMNRYAVRSIYFDTSNLMFYYEKIDGKKYRRKLRIRVYNEIEDNTDAFIEIKRKIDDTIMKERATIPINETANLANGNPVIKDDGVNHSYGDKVVSDRFSYLIQRLNLTPKALITYEREAFFDPMNPDLRVTFDYNVRSYFNPTIDDFFREQDLRTFTDPYVILEVKFSLAIPLWLRQAIRDFHLHLQSISKYCNGLDLWYDHEPQVEAS